MRTLTVEAEASPDRVPLIFIAVTSVLVGWFFWRIWGVHIRPDVVVQYQMAILVAGIVTLGLCLFWEHVSGQSFSLREIGITILFGFIFLGAIILGGSVTRNDAEEFVLSVLLLILAFRQGRVRVVSWFRWVNSLWLRRALAV